MLESTGRASRLQKLGEALYLVHGGRRSAMPFSGFSPHAHPSDGMVICSLKDQVGSLP